MQKYVWLGIAVTVILSVYLIVNFGLVPKTIPIVKASNFQSDAEIGKVVYRQMREKLQPINLVVFGYLPSQKEKVEKIAQSFVDNFNSDRLSPKPEVRFKEIGDLTKAAVEPPYKAVIMLALQDSFHPNENAKIKLIETQMNQPVLTIAAIPVKTEESESYETAGPCDDKEDMILVLKQLGCLQQKKIDQLLKSRRIDPKRSVALLEQVGATDFALYLNSK
jgi:hypothetical protein